MWSIFKYLNLVARLATLWANLGGVKAKDAATSASSYAGAADALFSHEAVEKFIATRLNDAQRTKLAEAETQQCFVWMMDFLTE